MYLCLSVCVFPNPNPNPGYVEEVFHKFLRRLGCRGPTTHINGRLLVGDNVDANFGDEGTWRPAHVTAIRQGLYDLQYADGGTELSVPRTLIRAQKFAVDDVVEANCGGKGVWHKSKVLEVLRDWCYKVRYGSKNASAPGVVHEATRERLRRKEQTASHRSEAKRRQKKKAFVDLAVSVDLSPSSKPTKSKRRRKSQLEKPFVDHAVSTFLSSPPTSSDSPPSPKSKLTKNQAMSQFRRKLRHFSTSTLMSKKPGEKFKLRFVEGLNQLTFNDDERFASANLIHGDGELAPHQYLRDLGCRGSTTHVTGQALRVGDNVDGNFTGSGTWYGAHVTSIRQGLYDLQYTDGDTELSVTATHIRAQKFAVNDVVEVNCGGKGVWYKCTVSEVVGDGSYKVKYHCSDIKWVTDKAIEAAPRQKHDKPLCAYGLVGWHIASRRDGTIVVRRLPQPLPPRGFAVTRRKTTKRMVAVQV